VSATIGLRGIFAERKILIKWGSAEFAGAQDERIFQQTTLVKVFEQTSDRFVVFCTLHWKGCFDACVMVPGAGPDLNEPHTRFGKTAGDKHLAPNFVGWLLTNPVQPLRCLRFLGDVHKVARFGLHAKS